jgi:formate hydrogenlyase transcriptional activator
MTLPPLRERREDIPLLAEHFVEKFAAQQGKVIDTIPDAVMAALEQYDWPGNIRQLQNIIERGVILTTGSVLSRQTTEHLTRGEAVPIGAHAVAEPVSIKTLAEAVLGHITATLRYTNWVVGGPNGAAAQLGLPRTTLIARMQRLGISNDASRSRSGQSSRGVVRMMEGLSSQLRDDSATGLRVVEAIAS